MVSLSVLGELAVFNANSIADLLEHDAEQRLAGADRQPPSRRRGRIAGALAAVSSYSRSVQQRQLERAAIRFEAEEYVRRLHEGIISREVYSDLRGQLAERRGAVSQRPPLDLGLELQAMIGRVSLFAALDREDHRPGRQAAARPGRLQVRRSSGSAGPSDAMYFVAAGEVVVHVPYLQVTLKEGDFFGEMGLLTSQPRMPTSSPTATAICSSSTNGTSTRSSRAGPTCVRKSKRSRPAASRRTAKAASLVGAPWSVAPAGAAGYQPRLPLCFWRFGVLGCSSTRRRWRASRGWPV